MRLAVIDSVSMSTGGENYTVRLLSAIVEASDTKIELFTPRPERWRQRFANWPSIAISEISARAIAELRPTSRRMPAVLRAPFEVLRGRSYEREEAKLRAAVADGFDAAFYPWPFSMRKPQLGIPEFFCPHDVTLTRFFGYSWNSTVFDRTTSDHARSALEPFFREAEAVVSSQFVRDEVEQLFGAAIPAAEVVPLARLSDPSDDESAPDAALIRARLGLPSDYVLWASNGMLHKNSTQLLSAWWHVKQSFSGVKLIICGYGVDQGLRLSARSRYFADHVTDESDWDALSIGLLSDEEFSAVLRGARCVVNTSRCEAGNGNGLDAWDLGVPVVMSDIPAFQEHLEFLGVDAEVFDPMNATSISDAICRVLGDPKRAAHMVATSQKAMERYGWADVANSYLRVFERGHPLAREQGVGATSR